MKLLYLMSLINMMIGTIITMSSSTWISAWMGMELNTMGFLPIMISNHSNSKEASMKYFIIQSISSSILIMSTTTTSSNILLYIFITNLTFMALSLKMALAPLHFWLPKIIESLKWSTTFIMLTWQKIPPIILMMQISSNLSLPFIITSTLIGSTMMFNQTSFKKIMAYSSIFHLSWLLLSLITNKFLISTNFMVYTISLLPMTMMMFILNINFINQTLHLPKKTKLFLMMSILMMAGFPPSMSFFQKMTLITMITSSNLLISISILLLITSTLTLFSYMQIIFIPLMNSQHTLTKITPLLSNFLWPTMFILLFFLPILFSMFSPN